jgi:phospholipase/carboxylesterase
MAIADQEILIGGWVIRLHQPEGTGPFPVILLLHGWTGDENSMWVFSPRLPKNAILIAPRGMYRAADAGYSWHPMISKPWPWINDFQPAVEQLFNIMSERNFPQGDFSNLHLVGFSQGAAFAYCIAIIYPDRVSSLAGLSGFLPDGASTWLGTNRLQNLPVFIAHGMQDNLVPVEKARQSVAELEKAGASVTYCEDDVGHKLSTKCFHGLEAFFQKVAC